MEKRRILLVDRDPDVGNSLQEFLKDDYEVFYLNDGSDILPSILKYDIDLVLTDIDLPNTYFYTVLNQLKTSFPQIPVFVMYVYCDCTQEMEEIIRKLADAIFLKPFDLQELKKRTDWHLADKRHSEITRNI